MCIRDSCVDVAIKDVDVINFQQSLCHRSALLLAQVGFDDLGIVEMCIRDSAWKDAVTFAILIIVLLFKPTGFLGRKVQEKV